MIYSNVVIDLMLEMLAFNFHDNALQVCMFPSLQFTRKVILAGKFYLSLIIFKIYLIKIKTNVHLRVEDRYINIDNQHKGADAISSWCYFFTFRLQWESGYVDVK